MCGSRFVYLFFFFVYFLYLSRGQETVHAIPSTLPTISSSISGSSLPSSSLTPTSSRSMYNDGVIYVIPATISIPISNQYEENGNVTASSSMAPYSQSVSISPSPSPSPSSSISKQSKSNSPSPSISQTPLCGSYNNPCVGLSQSVSVAMITGKTQIQAFPGTYLFSTLQITSSLSISSIAGPEQTFIHSTSFRLFNVDGTNQNNATFVLEGFTVMVNPQNGELLDITDCNSSFKNMIFAPGSESLFKTPVLNFVSSTGHEITLEQCIIQSYMSITIENPNGNANFTDVQFIMNRTTISDLSPSFIIQAEVTNITIKNLYAKNIGNLLQMALPNEGKGIIDNLCAIDISASRFLRIDPSSTGSLYISNYIMENSTVDFPINIPVSFSLQNATFSGVGFPSGFLVVSQYFPFFFQDVSFVNVHGLKPLVTTSHATFYHVSIHDCPGILFLDVIPMSSVYVYIPPYEYGIKVLPIVDDVNIRIVDSIFQDNLVPESSAFLKIENSEISIFDTLFNNTGSIVAVEATLSFHNCTFLNLSDSIILQNSQYSIMSSTFCGSARGSPAVAVDSIMLQLSIGSIGTIEDSTFFDLDYTIAVYIGAQSSAAIHRTSFSRTGSVYTDGGSILLDNVQCNNIDTNIFSAIYCSNGDVTITHSSFANCSSTNVAGALFVDGVSTFNITETEFMNCSAHSAGAAGFTSSVVGEIRGCIFRDCSARSTAGAVLLSGTSTSTFRDCIVMDNHAMSGGGIVLQDRAQVTMVDTVVLSNSALSSAGGLLIADYAIISIQNVTIENNRGGSTGGGFYVSNYAFIFSNASSIVKNSSPSQGAGFFAKDSATVNLHNTTITENFTNSTGGGFSLTGAAQGNFTFCSIGRNVASKGGGFAIQNSAAPSFSDCVIFNNNATTGGGVLITDLAHPDFYTCTFIDNQSETDAGGILATDNSRSVIEGCTFSQNEARSGTGGAVLLEDFTQFNMSTSYFISNHAYTGGAIMVTSKDKLTIVDCNFYNNTAVLNGGAMAFDEESDVFLRNGECANNTAEARGGCISIEGVASPDIIGIRIIQNLGKINGGGLYIADDSITKMENCTITKNSAAVGGGIFLEKHTKGSIAHSSFLANHANLGGGIFIQGCAVKFSDLLVEGNTANLGGGIVVEGTSQSLSLTRSIIQLNEAAFGGGGYITGDFYLNSNIGGFGNLSELVIRNNSATNCGGGLFTHSETPPTIHNSYIDHNYAGQLGGGIFVSGRQSFQHWIYGISFLNNVGEWGAANVGWEYTQNVTDANGFCIDCSLEVNDDSPGYQDENGFASYPFDMETNCPSHIMLDNGPVDLTLFLRDQFLTRVTGDLLSEQKIFVNITDMSGCDITYSGPVIQPLVATSGNATFENFQFSGIQNSTCSLTFEGLSEFGSFETSCSIILYGCTAGYGVNRNGTNTDDCVPNSINLYQILLLTGLGNFFILLCIIIIAGGNYWRRKREKQLLLERQGVLSIDHDKITIKDILNDPYIPNIKWKMITLDKQIGRGASGVVWSAKWNRGNGSEDIAVKEIQKMNFNQANLREFLREIKITSSLFHKKIVRFIGISAPSENEVFLITELMSRGSFRELLDNKNIAFTWDLRLKFAIDAAKGVEYLHARGLIHRDLKTSNLLVNQDCVCKVADFGISTVKQEDGDCVGTPVYMAPEILKQNIYSKQGDVYAWGIILHELYTKQYPYTEPEFISMHISHLTYQIAYHNIRPDCSKIHPVMRQLISDCWNSDPDLRPSFSEIIARLKRIQKMKLNVSDENLRSTSSLTDFSNNSATLPLLMDNSDGSGSSLEEQKWTAIN